MLCNDKKCKRSKAKFINPVHFFTIIVGEFTTIPIHVLATNDRQMIVQLPDGKLKTVNVKQMYNPLIVTSNDIHGTYIVPWTFADQSFKKNRFVGDTWMYAHEIFKNLLYAYDYFFINYKCLVPDIKIIIYHFFIKMIRPKKMVFRQLCDEQVDCINLMTKGICDSIKCPHKHAKFSFPEMINFFNVHIMNGNKLKKTVILSTKDCKSMTSQSGYERIPIRENNATRIAHDVNMPWYFPDSNYSGVSFSVALSKIKKTMVKYYLVFIKIFPHFLKIDIRVIIYNMFITLIKIEKCYIRQ
jgi:hypothetical protein